MSGRLIGPKTWDRIVGIYGTHFGQFRGCFWWLCDNLCNKLWFGVFGLEMAMDFGSIKWNRCLVSGLPTDSPLLVKWFMCVVSKILLRIV